MSFLSSGDNNAKAQLLTVAQEQTEIIRVADLAKTERAVRDQNTLNLAANTSIAMSTSKQKVVAILKKKDKKINEKQLILKKNDKTDSTLKNAAQNNTYDQVYTEILLGELKNYRKDLIETYKANTNKTDKQTLKEAVETANLLIGYNDQSQTQQ